CSAREGFPAMGAIELVSPLTPNECAARLREATDRDGLLSWFGTRPVLGRVSGRSVRLRKRGRRNSSQAILVGSLHELDGGTVFRGQSRWPRLVVGGLAVWFGGVVVIGGTAFVSTVRAMLAGGGQPLAVVIPPLMLAFGVVLVLLERRQVRD